jgi:phospholipid/cholesterol/gamma-HCH transport system substrate-binding protein
MNKRIYEFIVGLFLLVGFLALLELAFSVSGFKIVEPNNYYEISAQFDNIGGLKVRAPVSLSGVVVGRVQSIELDPKTLRANVFLLINNKYNNLPVDTSASIYTQGILGDNYIGLSPGFKLENLQAGDVIATTHSALVIENLLGKLLFNMNKDK